MIYFKNEVSKKILNGAKKVYEATKSTLGPNNISSIIYKDEDILIVDDGFTIASSITLDDKIENIGAQILIEAASEMKYDVGDGTTSTIIMAYCLLKSILKRKKNINKTFEKIENIKNKLFLELDKITKKADNNNILTKVFLTSTNDESLSLIIKNTLDKIGPNGIIDVEENVDETTLVEIEKGFYYYHGFYNESIFEYKNTVTSFNPLIIILDDAFDVDEIFTLVENSDLVLLAKEVSSDVVKKIILSNIRKKNKIFVIKLDENKNNINDLIYLSRYSIEKYGTCKKIIIDKNLTRFYFDENIINEYILELKKMKEEKANKLSIYNIERRISDLDKGSAVIKVGAKSELELKLKKYKIKDGINAIASAKTHGVVLGGGRGLLYACKNIEFKSMEEKIFLKAILKPFDCLIKNSEVDKRCLSEIKKAKELKAFDFKKQKWDYELYEPVNIIKKSIDVAISIVKTLTKINSVIVCEKSAKYISEEKMFDF